jgi:hypothetical protein
MERDGDGYKAMIRLLDAFGHGQFSTFNPNHPSNERKMHIEKF